MNNKKNLFIALAAFFFGILISGCSNPFLQLGSDSISQTAQGSFGAALNPLDLEDPGEEEAQKVTINFLYPKDYDEYSSTTPFYSQTIAVDSGAIDWDAAFQAYTDNMDPNPSGYLYMLYGYSYFNELGDDTLRCWYSSTGTTFNLSRPEIDLAAVCATMDGELEIYLTPNLQVREVEVIFCDFDGNPFYGYSILIQLAPAYGDPRANFINFYNLCYYDSYSAFPSCVYKMTILDAGDHSIYSFPPDAPELFNIEEQSNGTLRIIPEPYDDLGTW